MTHTQRPRIVRVSVIAVLALVGTLARPWLHAQGLPGPGGFLELATSTDTRTLLSAADLQALLPDRGPFTFPAPYGTTGVRLTNASDCGAGADCVQPLDGAIWRHINNSAGSNYLYVLVGLSQMHGGTGPTLFRFDKTTGDTVNLGPLFDEGDDLRLGNAFTWYFSATQPTTLYIGLDREFRRLDVLSHASSVVFDIAAQFGDDKEIWDPHSSNDDRVHSFGLALTANGQALGCGVYREDTHQFSFFPAVGTFLACQVDRSGQWLVIQEDQDGLGGEDNRIIDLTLGTATTLLDANGAAGTADIGFGALIAADDLNALPNAIRRWVFGPLGPGPVVYHDPAGQPPSFAHISFANARSAPLDQQFACGSSANRTNGPRANEIVCVKLDGSLSTLVVAPVMSDLDAPGGGVDEGNKAAVGMLDPTGEYFLWTSNAMGDRLDAFLVRIPGDLLVTPPSDGSAPAVSIGAPAHAATVSGVTPLTATASDNVGVTGVQFRLDGVNLGTELTTAPYGWDWNTATAADGVHVLTVVARDAAGNTAISVPVSVTVLNGATAPQISGVNASGIKATRALVGWATNQLADAQVEYGPTLAYGSSTPLDTALASAHLQLLTGLASGTTYHYRVTSRNSQGTATTSGDFTFTTEAALIISGVGASLQGTTAVIGWVTNLPSSSLLEYGLTSEYGDATDVGEALVLSHGLTLSDLSPGTTYHYRVYSVTVAGALAVSPDLTFTTPLGPGGPPAGAPGGFIEPATAANTRALLGAGTLQALVPARGAFTLPAPYGTTALRLTNDSDCSGADCVFAPGGANWRNLSNSAGSNFLYAVIGLDKAHGGAGPTVFRVDKTTQEVVNLGPLFSEADDLGWSSAAGWYFSATQPTTYYVSGDQQLRRYDVLTHAATVVFDVNAHFGADREVMQAHTSNDDRVHSFTLRRVSDVTVLGCGVYREDAQQFSFFPAVGVFRECHVDKSGRWLLITEGTDGDQNRIIDLVTGGSTPLTTARTAGGDSDLGFGAMVALDNFAPQPNALVRWALGPLAQGPLVYQDPLWLSRSFMYISFANARSAPLDQQYACGSAVNREDSPRANEIVCAKLDGSLSTLVVAPVMTDLNAPGGGAEANKRPNGNLDPTGQYFLWTSNLMGGRLDAFLVRVPSQLLVTPPTDITAPTVAITAPAQTATVSGTVVLSAAATDFAGVAGVQFQLDGVNLGAEVTTAPYAWMWNTTTSADGVHTLVAIARDAAGNTAMSVPVTVTVLNSAAPPAISDVTASSISATSAQIGWTTNQLADSRVDYGLTAAYGSTTGVDPVLTGSHVRLLTGLTAGTTYHYRVTSVNAQGAATSSGDVTFTTASAPVITAVGTSSVTDISAVVSWTTSIAASSQVEYGLTTAYGDATAFVPAAVTAHGLTVTGLTVGTTYHFRVFSVSQAGAMANSNDFTFATASFPVITNVAASSVSGISATIGWTTDQASSSQVEYGATAAYGSSTALDATLVTTHARALTGLTAGETYHYRVLSRSAAGLLTASADFVLTTPLPAPPAPVVWTSLVNTAVTGTILQKVGGCDGCPDAGAASLQYITSGDGYVEFTVTNTSSTGAVLGLSNANTGLTGGEIQFAFWVWGTYVEVRENGAFRADVSVSVNDVLRIAVVGGAVQYSKNGVVFFTSAAAPSYPLLVDTAFFAMNGVVVDAIIKGDALVPTPAAISNVAASGISGAAATITWQTDPAADSRVEYGPTIAYGSLTAIAPTLVSRHSQTVSGLSPGTTYHYRVLSTTSPGPQAASGDFTFTTGAAPTIFEVGAPSVTSTFVTIVWTTDQPTDSLVEYGTTTAYGSSSGVKPALVQSHVVTIGGLAPGQVYHYRVTSVNSVGTPASSADFTVTTPALGGPAPVVWTNLVNATLSGNVLQKTGGCDGCNDASADSVQHISSGDGYVEATSTALSDHLLGLVYVDPNGVGSHAYWLYFRSFGAVEVWEDGVYKWDTSYAVNDVLRVAVVGGAIKYSKNGTVFYTSATAPSYPLIAAAALEGAGSTVANAMFLGDAVSPPPVASAVTASGVTFNAATIGWTTNQAATTQVDYGLTTAYGGMTTLDGTLTTSHSVGLTGLQAGMTYHFRVRSVNAEGVLSVSGDFTFTAAPPGEEPSPAPAPAPRVP